VCFYISPQCHINAHRQNTQGPLTKATRRHRARPWSKEKIPSKCVFHQQVSFNLYTIPMTLTVDPPTYSFHSHRPPRLFSSSRPSTAGERVTKADAKLGKHSLKNFNTFTNHANACLSPLQCTGAMGSLARHWPAHWHQHHFKNEVHLNSNLVATRLENGGHWTPKQLQMSTKTQT
jgi:hypothetical protein